MAETGPKSGDKRPPQFPLPEEPSTSRRMLLLLPLMLAAMWFWKSTTEEAAQPPIAYSQLYQWVQQGKVEAVLLDGDVIDATLRAPEKLDGRSIKLLETNLPPNDAQLLPLLREKGVKITVKSQK